MDVGLTVKGADGFVLDGHSSIRQISRDPTDLVAQTIGSVHQYPDGFALFLGTMFAPVKDRDAPGQGFTHKRDDIVTIIGARSSASSSTACATAMSASLGRSVSAS